MIMLCQSCMPYRGYAIHIKVTEHYTTSFNGTEQRYIAVWSIHRNDDPMASTFATFPEPLAFISIGEALDYAQARAHTFIDSLSASRSTAVA
jgi:hypothetical protein